MANPQKENGHVRIANEIYDEILKRDFSKRQLNIIMFIIRYSYGFQRKACQFEFINDFELAGIPKQAIRAELIRLREAKVIAWDEKLNIFEFNKNFDNWKISNHKNFKFNKFEQLIKYVLHGTQNINHVVHKILTNGLIKCELTHPEQEDTEQDLIPPKEIERNIKKIKEIHTLSEKNFFGEFQQVNLSEQEYQDFIGRCLSKTLADELISQLDCNLKSGSDIVKIDGHFARLCSYLNNRKKTKIKPEWKEEKIDKSFKISRESKSGWTLDPDK